MRKVYQWFAIVVALASVIVYVMTFLPFTLPFKQVWLLHLVAMAAFAPMVFALKKCEQDSAPQNPRNLWTEFTARRKVSKRIHRVVLAQVPVGVRFCCLAVFVYVGINFFLLSTRSLETGEERNGHYVVTKHGQTVEELTPAEYRQRQAHLVRLFSGHWILFSFIPAVFFTFVNPGSVAVRLRENSVG